MSPVHKRFPDLDDRTFAVAFVSLFMQIIGVLQSPYAFGPTWSPFEALAEMAMPPASQIKEKKDRSNPQDSASESDEPKKAKRTKRKNKNKPKKA